MTTKTSDELCRCSAWWDTSIIDIHPGKIAIRGYPIEELIGRVRFPDMIWLMLRGELPSRGQSDLLEAALVPGVDHGPHAPSIAIARMAVTCGLPVNGAMASAINVLDDIHGGAGQQCVELYREIDAEAGEDGDLVARGHRRHPSAIATRARRSFPASATASIRSIRGPRRCSSSSRRPKLPAWLRGAARRSGTRSKLRIEASPKRHIPMNIDGITAVIFCELGFEPELGRGLCSSCRARSAFSPTRGSRSSAAAASWGRCRRRFRIATAGRRVAPCRLTPPQVRAATTEPHRPAAPCRATEGPEERADEGPDSRTSW